VTKSKIREVGIIWTEDQPQTPSLRLIAIIKNVIDEPFKFFTVLKIIESEQEKSSIKKSLFI
jgi:hypothetical protein